MSEPVNLFDQSTALARAILRTKNVHVSFRFSYPDIVEIIVSLRTLRHDGLTRSSLPLAYGTFPSLSFNNFEDHKENVITLINKAKLALLMPRTSSND